MLEMPPFLPFFIGALIAAATRGVLRNAIMLATPVLSALHLWMVPEGIHLQFAFFDYQLTPYRADKLSFMFGYVFHIAALIAIIYSLLWFLSGCIPGLAVNDTPQNAVN